MKLSIDASFADENLSADVDLYSVKYNNKQVTCVSFGDVPIYICDGAMILESGKAYRAGGMAADYSKLFAGAATIYNSVEVTMTESNGIKTYHAEASGDEARDLLVTLLSDYADLLGDTASVALDLIVSDGEMRTLDAVWTGASGSVSAALSVDSARTVHTLPSEVRAAIDQGRFEELGEIGDDIRNLMLAWTEISSRGSVSANVSLAANCGPVIMNDRFVWQLSRDYSEKLSSVLMGGSRVYFTDDAMCAENGYLFSNYSDRYNDSEKLLKMAYTALLLGDLSCSEVEDGCNYTVTLDDDAMQSFASLIAPAALDLGVSLQKGTVTLELRGGRFSGLRVSCSGSVRVVRTDINARLSAGLNFDDSAFVAPPAEVLEKLGITEK
jgi:hypothetical protein